MMQDLGFHFLDSILCSLRQSVAEFELPEPGVYFAVAGANTPTTDACDGQIWVRLVSQAPTDGSGAPFVSMRADFGIPAWVYSFEVGVLWCHEVIEEDGTSPDYDVWTANACRDASYRAALVWALTQLLPPEIKPCALGMTLSPWSPIGPDGGLSGGIFRLDLVSASLTI